MRSVLALCVLISACSTPAQDAIPPDMPTPPAVEYVAPVSRVKPTLRAINRDAYEYMTDPESTAAGMAHIRDPIGNPAP